MPSKKSKKQGQRSKRPFQRTFIKQWRDYRELSQEQLAERVTAYLVEHGTGDGYTHASIGRLERGLMPYSQPILEALADSLGTDPASLLIRDPTDPTGIWTIWEKALPEQRATITEHAEIVVKKLHKA
jgi:transcriptional regulator with XRE-family HTH domain